MNGSEKQIELAKQIISGFVANCETIKAAMTARIEKYHARSAKTGRDFSEQIADTNAEIASVNKSIKIAQGATNAAKIINLRHILEEATENSTWLENGLYNLYLITK